MELRKRLEAAGVLALGCAQTYAGVDFVLRADLQFALTSY